MKKNQPKSLLFNVMNVTSNTMETNCNVIFPRILASLREFAQKLLRVEIKKLIMYYLNPDLRFSYSEIFSKTRFASSYTSCSLEKSIVLLTRILSCLLSLALLRSFRASAGAENVIPLVWSDWKKRRIRAEKLLMIWFPKNAHIIINSKLDTRHMDFYLYYE